MDTRIYAKSSWRRGGVPGAVMERSTSNKNKENTKTMKLSDLVLRCFFYQVLENNYPGRLAKINRKQCWNLTPKGVKKGALNVIGKEGLLKLLRLYCFMEIIVLLL